MYWWHWLKKEKKKILITFLIKFTCERSNPYSSHLFSSVPKRTNTSGITAKVSYKLINKLITLIFNTIQDALGTNNISSANENMIPSAYDQITFSDTSSVPFFLFITLEQCFQHQTCKVQTTTSQAEISIFTGLVIIRTDPIWPNFLELVGDRVIAPRPFLLWKILSNHNLCPNFVVEMM